ncbi:Bacteriophage rv5, Orf52 [uncultured Caudovirales phage]|uniref:Bacteriophage rv5, Orf52 n=1 Tax=uncultured Caudovirales phage TaxID=2100421 RepID=A0A6J5MUQ2_9CAUD|nr:Bacteriophage rv5, Orf52 [uncultured Caudovirales phage]
MGVYSFLNVNAAIAGPGGAANLGAGAAAAEEGITIEPAEDKNVMTIGADGAGQHSLIASDARTATIRLLKTSPINAILMAMYNVQSSSSALWGRNVITVVDSARADITTLQACAFKKVPSLNYAKEGGMNEWVFDCIKGDSVLGVG